MIGRWLREGRLWAVAAMVIVAALLPTTTVAASTFIYDARADTRVDTCAFASSAVGLTQLSDARRRLPRCRSSPGARLRPSPHSLNATDVAITGWNAWNETEGEPVWYQIGYTTAETGIKVGAAAGGGALGVKWVGRFCRAWPCVVAGGVGGALFASVAADHASDFVMERIG